MNCYIVVEDKYTPDVYQYWIRYINPALHEVLYPRDISQDCFYFSRGYGYPHYFEVIEADIQTAIALNNIDRFIICIDAEDMSYADKYMEVESVVQQYRAKLNIIIVVQYFCFETWALGNRLLIKRNPQNTSLREYLRHYNVLANDPENLPPYKGLNRCQFAEVYLRAACIERYKTYQKYNPAILQHPKYFTRLVERLDDTAHIMSFRNFLNAFS